MERQIKIKECNNKHRESIIALLRSENLPVEDLPADLHDFFIALDEDTVAGTVGLERYSNCGLLRSLVVDKDYRDEKLGGKLVMQLEEKAKALGVTCMYLFTETATDYFTKKGYVRVKREEVPADVKKSSEFSHVCPESAIVMQKYIE
jgi:amino-acid N-acetyltransferase